jgi:hypothetical protein
MRTLIILYLVVFCLSEKGVAQPWFQDTVLIQPIGNFDDGFAHTVVLEGNWLFVSMPSKDNGVVLVYHYSEDDWELRQQLTPSGNGFGTFGKSIDCNGDYLVIGSYKDSEVSFYGGAAYVYRLLEDEWVFVQKATAPTPNPLDYFGFSVSLSASVLVVGAYGFGPEITVVTSSGNPVTFYHENGVAYVYRLEDSAWNFEQQLCPCYYNEEQRKVGYHVAASDSLIIVAGRTSEILEFGYDGNEWNLSQKLRDSEQHCVNPYPRVLVNSSRTIVGIPGRTCNDPPILNADALIEYSCLGAPCIVIDRIIETDQTAVKSIGHSMSANGSTLVVGSPADSLTTLTCGSARVFERCQGALSEAQVLESEDSDCQFGHSVSVSGSFIAVSQPLSNEDSSGLGMVHIYRRNLKFVHQTSIDDIDVYPNPSNGIIWVKSRSGLAPQQIEVFDNMGRLVFQQSNCCVTKSYQLNMNLDKGSYYIRLNGTTGWVVKKIVITD